MRTLLGLAVGTSGARAVAVDHAGRLVASAFADYPLLSPHPGWTEQQPQDWWLASRAVLGRVAADVGGEVAGIGLTGQMHAPVFLDERDGIVRPALLGNDRRTTSQCDEITRRIGAERLIEITGNPALPIFQAPKILWLRDVEPVQYRHVRHILLPKDYLRFMLTGERITDVSDASGTLLLDLRRRDWSAQMLAALEIPRAWLASVQESTEVAGHLAPAIAAELGLPPRTPVAAGAGDLAAAALGAGIAAPGLIGASIGASGLLFAPADQLVIDPSGRLRAYAHAVPHRYHLAAVTLAAGASLRWWRDILGGGLSYEQLATLASSAPPGADGLFFLPYLLSEGAPDVDPNSRGAFVGLRAHHSRADLTRALMEGVVFSLRDSLDIMRGLGLAVRRVRTGGGAAQSPFWRRLQADIFNLPVERTVRDDGPAYGAALLAGVAVGRFRDVAEATQRVRPREGVNQPHAEDARRYETIYAAFRNLAQALHPPLPPQSSGATSASVSEKVH